MALWDRFLNRVFGARVAGAWAQRSANRAAAKAQAELRGKRGGKMVEGHRGIGVGLGAKPGPKKSTGQDVNRQSIGKDEIEDFLWHGAPLFVYSSNVGFCQYYPETEKMQIEYLAKGNKPARKYLYSSVTHAEALDFAQAQSKGIWVWDHIRVRGKGNAHLSRKPFVEL